MILKLSDQFGFPISKVVASCNLFKVKIKMTCMLSPFEILELYNNGHGALKYTGPILRVMSPALDSDDLTLDQSATSIQILPEPALVTFFYKITTLTAMDMPIQRCCTTLGYKKVYHIW